MKKTFTALAAVVVISALAACGGGGGNSGSSSGSVGGSAADSRAVVGAAAPEAGGGKSDGQSGGAGKSDDSQANSSVPLLQDRRLVVNGTLTVTVAKVFDASAKIRALVDGLGGYVGDEKTSSAPGEPADSLMVLRVPRDQMDTLVSQVAALGTVVSRGQSSEDVTQQTVDVSSRLATEKASVARVRALLARATKISDIVAIEGELSRRESDLESMEAQLKSLNDSADLATLTVTLSPPAVRPPAHRHQDDSGFVAGLRHGWSAFSTALVGALTVVGALLPFAVVAALVGLPAWRLIRRRRTPAQPQTQAQPVEV